MVFSIAKYVPGKGSKPLVVVLTMMGTAEVGVGRGGINSRGMAAEARELRAVEVYLFLAKPFSEVMGVPVLTQNRRKT